MNSLINYKAPEPTPIFNDAYADGLAELVAYYCEQPTIEEMLIKFQSVRSVIVGLYQVLVNKGEIVKIQELEKEEKEKLWKEVPKDLSLRERVEIVKSLYLIKIIKK